MAKPIAKRSVPPHLRRLHALAGLPRIDVGGEPSIDWSPWYLSEEEDMGQSPEQGSLIEVLRSSIEVLAEERAWESVMVGSDHFFAWVPDQPLVQVSPDVFLLDDPPGPEDRLPRRWETWHPGQNPPRFAVDIVSTKWQKDYEINPARYDHLGVSELVIADAEAVFRDLEDRGRFPLLVYRRNAQDRLELVHKGGGWAHCSEIDAFVGFQRTAPGRVLIRVSKDPEGRDIVPTALELAAARTAEVKELRARLRELEQTKG